ncbi:MAG TPA: ABC transporter ATP-binding protein, partial [Ktedonobacterales bacterium]
LSVDYGSGSAAVHAVDNVSLTLGRGEILGLAGESGSGKSTLAHAVARLMRPPARIVHGEVLYYPAATPATSSPGASAVSPEMATSPVDVLALSPAELQAFRWRQLAIVFQSAMNALNPVLDIGTQITDVLAAHIPGMSRGSRQERAAELLRTVGITPDRLHSFPHELSGGMRQRAIIAIALALNPSLIIMDEPTTALDVVVQREILTELLRLREQFHFSVIFITHDLSLLIELADRVAIMYAGRIVEEASQRDLYLRPRHPYSYGLIHSFPTLHGPRRRALGIPGTPPDLRAVPSGCAFHPRCPLAFGACTTDLPFLHPLPAGSDSEHEQQVACHLYDPRFTPIFPTTAAIAEKYEALAEGSGVR